MHTITIVDSAGRIVCQLSHSDEESLLASIRPGQYLVEGEMPPLPAHWSFDRKAWLPFEAP